MPTKTIANTEVDFDDEGFMTDPQQWSKEIGAELAKEEGIEMTDAHWKVIEFLRKDAEENGQPPSIRRMKKVGGIATKELYDLFPKGPAKKAARIAGFPKPQGCV
jgi:tRNA 2-thiouridine synthesizing protein E